MRKKVLNLQKRWSNRIERNRRIIKSKILESLIIKVLNDFQCLGELGRYSSNLWSILFDTTKLDHWGQI